MSGKGPRDLPPLPNARVRDASPDLWFFPIQPVKLNISPTELGPVWRALPDSKKKELLELLQKDGPVQFGLALKNLREGLNLVGEISPQSNMPQSEAQQVAQAGGATEKPRPLVWLGTGLEPRNWVSALFEQRLIRAETKEKALGQVSRHFVAAGGKRLELLSQSEIKNCAFEAKIEEDVSPVVWLGTGVQLAQEALALFDKRLIEAGTKTEACCQAVEHFVRRGGRRFTPKVLIESERNKRSFEEGRRV